MGEEETQAQRARARRDKTNLTVSRRNPEFPRSAPIPRPGCAAPRNSAAPAQAYVVELRGGLDLVSARRASDPGFPFEQTTRAGRERARVRRARVVCSKSRFPLQCKYSYTQALTVRRGAPAQSGL